MKRLYVSFIIIFTLFGCSNEKKDSDAQPANTGSFEEQIINVMSENELSNKEIIDYDIKDNFVYVIFNNITSHNSNPDLVILENEDGKLEWVAGPDDRTTSVDSAMIFGRADGSSVTLLLPVNNTEIKEIKVLGESAKAVTYTEQLSDDISKQNTYWIAYTDEEPTADDIEVIMNGESHLSSQDENLSTLETVLENTFTGPSQELNELLEDPNNATIIGKDSETKSPESPTDLDLFLEKMYQPHFTEDMYSEYIGVYALSYQPTSNNQTEVDSLDVEQNDSNKNTYDFTLNVQFQKDGNEIEIYELTGQATFSEEGKIAGFEMFSDNGLSEALNAG